MNTHDPFGYADPFARPAAQAPGGSLPASPPQYLPAPAPMGCDEKTVRISVAGNRGTPGAATAQPAAGYAFSGIGAVLLTAAIATGLALPELTMFYGDVTTPALAAVAGLTALAAAVCWQALRCARGRRFTRLLTLTGCGATVALAAGGWILNPGSQVEWFAQLIRIAGIVAAVGALVTAVLLLWPRSAKPGRKNTTPPPVPTTPPVPPWQHAPPRQTYSAPADYDPFG